MTTTTHDPLCEFCNMIRFDEGFSLEAIYSSSMYEGRNQSRHFLGYPFSLSTMIKASKDEPEK